jgi:hypothetical protein
MMRLGTVLAIGLALAIGGGAAGQEAGAAPAPAAEAPPTAGTAIILLAVIGELARGQPDYARFSPELAEATRSQLPQIQGALAALGSVSGVRLKEVTASGVGVYEVKFEKGLTEWRMVLGPDGRIAGLYFFPASA